MALLGASGARSSGADLDLELSKPGGVPARDRSDRIAAPVFHRTEDVALAQQLHCWVRRCGKECVRR